MNVKYSGLNEVIALYDCPTSPSQSNHSNFYDMEHYREAGTAKSICLPFREYKKYLLHI